MANYLIIPQTRMISVSPRHRQLCAIRP